MNMVFSSMKSSWPLSSLPTGYIKHIYKEEDPIEESVAHIMFEK